jgi:hypothetical protein
MNENSSAAPLRRHEKYDRLVAATKGQQPLATAVAHPCDETSLKGAVEAAAAGLIKPPLAIAILLWNLLPKQGRALKHFGSVLLLYPAAVLDRHRVVVSILFVAIWQLDRLTGLGLVGKQAQEMRNNIEPRAPLVVRSHDMPWRKFGVRRPQHQVPGA